MIYALVGRPGTGKTYSLVHIAYKAVLRGQSVYTNFDINFDHKLKKYVRRNNKLNRYLNRYTNNRWGNKYFSLDRFGSIYKWKTLDDFVFLKEGIILMDEAQIYINSRQFMNLPPSVQYKFQQHRKHRLDLYLAVQNIKRIDIVARELVNSVFEFKRVGKVFIMKEYDIDDVDKAKRTSYSQRFFLFRKWLAKSYDTYKEIKK